LVVADHPLLLTAFVLADYIGPHGRMYRLPGGYVVPKASHQAVASFACLGRERLMEQPVSSRITSCKTETQATFRSHEHVFGNVQTDHLLAVHGADDLPGVHSCITIHSGSSMVFVKTAVYHALGTLMPYPSEDPTHAGWFLPD
jgi:hypothetical protein